MLHMYQNNDINILILVQDHILVNQLTKKNWLSKSAYASANVTVVMISKFKRSLRRSGPSQDGGAIMLNKSSSLMLYP